MRESFGVAASDAHREAIKPLSRTFASGSITTLEYVKEVASILQVPVPSVESFENATIRATFDPSVEMKELVDAVKARGIKVSLLSDMYLFEVIKTRPLGRYDQFDHVAFSAEAGYTKAAPEFFMQSLRHFGYEPHEVLFVDDILGHIRTAQSLGIDTIHADKVTFPAAIDLADTIKAKILGPASDTM